MSHSVTVKTHCRTLMAIYDTKTRSYGELLILSRKKNILTQNLQILVFEVYKWLNNISPPFTWDYFKQKNNQCNFRNTQLLELRKCRARTYGYYSKALSCWINCPIILRKQNLLHVSKIALGNGQGVHACICSWFFSF